MGLAHGAAGTALLVLLAVGCVEAEVAATGIEPIVAEVVPPPVATSAEVADEPDPRPEPGPVAVDDEATAGSGGAGTADGDLAATEEGAAGAVEIDLAVVPDDITVAYVDAVLVELERLYAEAARYTAASGELTIEAADRLSSAFARDLVDRRFGDFQVLLAAEYGFLPPGEIEPGWLAVEEVLDASPTCVWLVGEQDLSSIFVNGPGARTTFALLGPKPDGLVVDLNPTPWVYRQIGVGDEHTLREERPC